MDASFADLFKLDDRVALVTGASSGIGVGLARGLARAGANVVVTARRQEMIDETARIIRNFGVEAEAWTCDITDETAFEALFGRVTERFGRLDIMVNNAGFTDRTALRHDQNQMRRFRSVVELDLLATMNSYLPSWLLSRRRWYSPRAAPHSWRPLKMESSASERHSASRKASSMPVPMIGSLR